jgi:hypothetical protein
LNNAERVEELLFEMKRASALFFYFPAQRLEEVTNGDFLVSLVPQGKVGIYAIANTSTLLILVYIAGSFEVGDNLAYCSLCYPYLP